MKTFTKKDSDGSINITRIHNNKIYTKKYANQKEYNDYLKSGGFGIWKVLLVPIYYPVKWVFKILFLLIKGIYWDMPRFIYNKIKK